MMMMIIKRKGVGLLTACIALAALLFYLSFIREGEMGSPPERQLELQTFQLRNGWGYQVVMNGKVLIYQPTIPSIDTVMAFPDEESARSIGLLVLDRLAGNRDFSVTREEIQHSLSY